MNLPSRRKLGATALVVAAVGAFLVPFLMHSNAKPVSPTAPGGGNGGTTTPTTPGSTTTSSDNNDKSGGNTGSTGTEDHGDHDNDTSDSGSSETCTTTQSTQSSQSSDSNVQWETGDHNTGNSDHQDNGNGKHNGNAFGLMKNEMDLTIATVKSMGAHNPAFQLHHDTDTDNDAGHSHAHVSNNAIDSTSSCDTADTEKDD